MNNKTEEEATDRISPHCLLPPQWTNSKTSGPTATIAIVAQQNLWLKDLEKLVIALYM
jgi:hypothetical protein